MKTHAQLTDDQKAVINKQEASRLLAELAAAFDRAAASTPNWMTAAEATTYSTIANQAVQAGVGGYYFIVRLYATAAMKDAIMREALARAQAKKFADPGETIDPPVVGENSGI